MVNEYKKIVLLTGLEAMKDYEFRLIKSLLTEDLKLTRNMKDDYDRIRIADLMEEKFQSDAGLRKLIEVCKDIPALAELAETLEKQRLKVKRKSKGKRKSTVKKAQQDEPTTAHSMSLPSTDSEPESKEKIPSLKQTKIEKSVSLVNEKEKISSSLQEEQEMEATNNKTNNRKVQESQGHRQLPELSQIGVKPSQCIFYTLQMPPTAPSSSLQTPQMSPTAPPGRTHTPHLPLTSLRELQTPHLSLTSPSTVQNLHMFPTNPSGRIQTLHFSPISSSPHLPQTSCSKIQTPYVSLTLSNSLQTPQVLPTESSNIIQNSQVCPATPSTGQQTKQKTETSFSTCLPKKPRLTIIPKEASEEYGCQKGPKEVMVLKATEPFIYDFKENGKKMFHATVATESEFFQVKVFDVNLRDKFISKKVIAISDYIGRNGFLEIYSASNVSDVSTNRKMEISPTLVKNAKATPKIEDLCSKNTIKYVNGVYRVYKKNIREDCTYYEIQDDTGKMEVVVYGRLSYINCEEGDKLNLFCFELAFNADKWQLRSVLHSYIKVIKARKVKTEPLNHDSNMDTSQESS